MNARIPCLASRDADELAHKQGKYDAEDSFLDAYVQIHYGPDYAPEFVIEAMKEIPFALAKVIAELKDYTAQGEAIENWLSKYAYQCARRNISEARCATLEAALQRQFAEPMPPELVRAALATQPQALEFSADAI